MYFHFSDDKKNSPSEETGPVMDAETTESISEQDKESEEGNSSEFSRLEKEIAGLKEQMLRAMAEAENVRKRSVKEKEELSKYAVTDFSRSLLGVADNLRRALESSATVEKTENSQIQNIIAGVEMTEKELDTIFEKYGIQKISPKGDKFDPHNHQAVMEVNSDQENGTVVDVLQVGYSIHDRVLRPAMVSVAKNK